MEQSANVPIGDVVTFENWERNDRRPIMQLSLLEKNLSFPDIVFVSVMMMMMMMMMIVLCSPVYPHHQSYQQRCLVEDAYSAHNGVGIDVDVDFGIFASLISFAVVCSAI